MSEKKPAHEKVANIPPFGLRMQPELRDRIAEAAKVSNRSMNAEIVARLEASFAFAAMMSANERTIRAQKEHIGLSEEAVSLMRTALSIALDGKLPEDSQRIFRQLIEENKDKDKNVLYKGTKRT